MSKELSKYMSTKFNELLKDLTYSELGKLKEHLETTLKEKPLCYEVMFRLTIPYSATDGRTNSLSDPDSFADDLWEQLVTRWDLATNSFEIISSREIDL
jgi:hypothetical protein